MKYRINYSKVISQADSIAGNAADLSAQIRALEQADPSGRDRLQMSLLQNSAHCGKK